MRARIEKVNANAVTMWTILGKDGMAGEFSEGKKGVDSSPAASSRSSACRREGVGDGSRSGEESGMLWARRPTRWQSKRLNR